MWNVGVSDFGERFSRGIFSMEFLFREFFCLLGLMLAERQDGEKMQMVQVGVVNES